TQDDAIRHYMETHRDQIQEEYKKLPETQGGRFIYAEVFAGNCGRPRCGTSGRTAAGIPVPAPGPIARRQHHNGLFLLTMARKAPFIPSTVVRTISCIPIVVLPP